MLKKILFIFCAFLIVIALKAQANEQDMKEYYPGFSFVKGIYMSFDEFKNNNPTYKIEFQKRGENIYIYDDSLKKDVAVNPNKVWGYSDGSNIYISQEEAFWKLITIGKLNQFTAIVITRFSTVDAFGFPIDRYSKMLSQLFFDFQDGEVKRLEKSNLKPYLEAEPLLYNKIKKKLKNDAGLVLAIKSINQLYPIYFPTHE